MLLQCRILGVSRSGYYAWKRRPSMPMPKRLEEDQRLLAQIEASHAESDQTYGAPRLYRDLRARGYRTSRKRVARLMRQAGLRASRPRRFTTTTDSTHRYAVAENVLDRDFTAAAPDRKWASDITYLWTDEGWLYLAVVIDLFSRRVVGHAMAKTLEATLVEDALALALTRRRAGRGLVHHSDRGVQYAATVFQGFLLRHGIVQSMSRRGNCWDNAPVESFFATLKRERVYRRHYRTRGEARADVFHYIERFYNARRRHSTLGYLSPVAFEEKHRATRALAA